MEDYENIYDSFERIMTIRSDRDTEHLVYVSNKKPHDILHHLVSYAVDVVAASFAPIAGLNAPIQRDFIALTIMEPIHRSSSHFHQIMEPQDNLL